MSASKPKLHYFNSRGRAELIRLVFAATGTDYEDLRHTREEWTAEQKKHSPTGMMPYVESDKGALAQSGAIARYYAKLGGLMGANDWEYYLIERVMAQAEDVFQEIIKIYFTPEDKRPEALKAFQEDKGQKLIGCLVQFLKDNGNSGFFAGKTVSLADLASISLLDAVAIMMPDYIPSKFPELVQHKERVMAANAKVAEWLKTRPDTPM